MVGTANREGSIDSNSYKKNLSALATKNNSSSYYVDTYPQNPKEGDIITFTDDTPSKEYINGEWKDRSAGGVDIETLVNSEDFVAGVLDAVSNIDKSLYVTFGASSPDEVELLEYNLPLTLVKLAVLLTYIQYNTYEFQVETRWAYTGEGPIPEGFPTEPIPNVIPLYFDRNTDKTPYLHLGDKYYTWEDNNTLIEYSPMEI